MKSGTKIKILIMMIWMGLLSIAVYYYIQNNRSLMDYLPLIQTEISNYGVLAPVFYIILYCLRPLILFPATALTTISGTLFGPYKGVLYTMIGENISANITFLLGRYLGGDLSEFINSKIKTAAFLDCKFKENGFSAVLIMRLIYMPFDLVGMLSGMCKIRQIEFALATFIGIIPGVITFVYLGSSFTEPKSILISVICFILGILLSKWLKKHRKVIV
jgi:uncharacterized membrane protein YdjX (TVP38/TMEM64 family)